MIEETQIVESKPLIIAGTQKELHRHCKRCRRSLKNPKYMELGYGPVCILKVRGI